MTITGNWYLDLKLNQVIILSNDFCADKAVRVMIDDYDDLVISHEYRDFIDPQDQTVPIPSITVHPPSCFTRIYDSDSFYYYDSGGSSDPSISLDYDYG